MSFIELDNIGKRYRLEYRSRFSLRESFSGLFRKGSGNNEFWALRGINLEVEGGKTLGVIGRNASGKTTLLRLIAGLSRPTEGRIRTKGRIVSLLEIGAGFQGDLTGRENIFLNGLLLGLTRRQIQQDLISIIDFADIGGFIDAAVRTYSSGMYMRLGFAIAMHSCFDLLLIDEVLAVGDAAFQNKCFERITGFKKEGKTIIFVSHNLETVKDFSDNVLLLDGGRIIDYGARDKAVNRYLVSLDNQEKDQIKKDDFTKEISLTNVYFENASGQITREFENGSAVRVVIEYEAKRRIESPVFGIGIYSGESFLIGPNTRDDRYPIDSVEGKGRIEFVIENIPFAPGEYEVSASAHNLDETCHYDCCFRLFKFKVFPGEKTIKYGLISISGRWSTPKNT